MFLLLLLFGVALVATLFLLRRNASNQSGGSWVRRIRIATLFVIGAVLLAPSSAFAAVAPIGPDAKTDSLFSLDPFVVTMLLGPLIPAAIALVTKASTAAWVKKVLTLVLSGVAGVLTVGLQDGGAAWVSVASLKSAGLAFISAVAAYFGLLRNSTTERTLQQVGPSDQPPGE